MELLSLRTFKAVVEEGGVQAASRLLHTVQSNITARIKRLEDELETPLFYRSGRKLELTPAGSALLDYANKLLLLEHQARMAVKQVGAVGGELRIGAMESFAAVRMPGLLQALRKEHPKLRPRIKTETSGALIKDVLEYRVDCAFVGGPVEHSELICHEVLVEELVLVSARDMAVADALIMFREGCAYRQRALSWLRDQGRVDTEVMNMGTQEGILGCVAVGLGYTLVPRKVVEESRYAGDLRIETLAPEYARVPTLLVTHKDAMSMAAIETLRQLFKSKCPEWESAA